MGIVDSNAAIVDGDAEWLPFNRVGRRKLHDVSGEHLTRHHMVGEN
jgi:hypothetical protein